MDANAALGFNRQKVAAGAIAATAMLGLCSCTTSPTPDPTVSPTTSVEQTVEPTPDVSPTGEPWEEPSADPDTPEASKYPALDAEGYEFSDEPQNAAEEKLQADYPEMWDAGVRALSDKMVDGYNWGDESYPAPTVIYIDGKRYEGTETVPLGFRGKYDSPDAYPTDTYDGMVAGTHDPSTTVDKLGNVGQGGYVINIIENNPGKGGAVMTIGLGRYSGMPETVSEMEFSSWSEAWDYLQDNNFQAEGMDRPLNKGELGNITAVDKGKGQKTKFMVFNGATGEWDIILEN
ncbi:hypothetical protein ON058_00015 [Demequina sp. B12]|uniref:hypothetical protein n=1 Tax=Demequina sp. B12 TaxID=2992757 RepID=UPI00237BB394|nr:hypothetical protein [Demequina sp. B12]MDE0571799.1 hypothetical protein [Demequina sp. B12]